MKKGGWIVAKGGAEANYPVILTKSSNEHCIQQPKSRRSQAVPASTCAWHVSNLRPSPKSISSSEVFATPFAFPSRKRYTMKPSQIQSLVQKTSQQDVTNSETIPRYRLPPLSSLYNDQFLYRSMHSLISTMTDSSSDDPVVRNLSCKILASKYREKVQLLFFQHTLNAEKVYKVLTEGLSELATALPEAEGFLELMIGLVNILQENLREQEQEQENKKADREQETLPHAVSVETATMTTVNGQELASGRGKRRPHAITKMLSASVELTAKETMLTSPMPSYKKRPVVPKLRLDFIRQPQFFSHYLTVLAILPIFYFVCIILIVVRIALFVSVSMQQINTGAECI